MSVPETNYAKTADGIHIAYQVLGDGPTDLVYVPGFVFNVEQLWEGRWPLLEQLIRRVAEFSRLIVFDRRGTGLSDHIVPTDQHATLEARMDDIRAVMDAAGSDRATLFGFGEGFYPCALFAATYPERTAALVSFSAAAAGPWAPDYPWAWTDQQWEAWFEEIEEGWGTEEYAARWSAIVWPEIRDPEWVRGYATWMRRSVSPGDAVRLFRIDSETDVRDLLPLIQVPSLILHRTEDRTEPVEQARYIAGRIPGATLVELPGSNSIPSPDQEDVLGELERFMSQLRAEEAEFDRVLATVLITDIVASTERVAELGDRAWKDLLARHHSIVRGQIGRYRGREVDTAGDGFLATFDGPARAVRCARAIVEGVRQLDLEVRAGVHTGEIELDGDKVRGIAVHIGARVAAICSPSEVLVSSTVKDLTAGSGLVFEDVGEHELKGVPDRWHLYRVVG